METGDLAAGALELGLYELLRQRLLQGVLVASPVAGAEWTATPPNGAAWEVLAAREQLTTSAAVATRVASLVLKDPNGVQFALVPPNVTQAASLVTNYTYLAGYGDHLATGGAVQALPDPALIVPAGWSIGSSTASMDVADQYAGVRLFVREWSLLEVAQAGEWYGHRQWPM